MTDFGADFLQGGGVAVNADGQLQSGFVLGIDDLGEGGSRGNGAGAAESFKFGLLDFAVFIQLEGQLERVAAGQRPHLADAVGRNLVRQRLRK